MRFAFEKCRATVYFPSLIYGLRYSHIVNHSLVNLRRRICEIFHAGVSIISVIFVQLAFSFRDFWKMRVEIELHFRF